MKAVPYCSNCSDRRADYWFYRAHPPNWMTAYCQECLPEMERIARDSGIGYWSRLIEYAENTTLQENK